MNDGMETESKDDDDPQCVTNEETDPQSMDEELGDVFLMISNISKMKQWRSCPLSSAYSILIPFMTSK